MKTKHQHCADVITNQIGLPHFTIEQSKRLTEILAEHFPEDSSRGMPSEPKLKDVAAKPKTRQWTAQQAITLYDTIEALLNQFERDNNK